MTDRSHIIEPEDEFLKHSLKERDLQKEGKERILNDSVDPKATGDLATKPIQEIKRKVGIDSQSKDLDAEGFRSQS